MRLRFDELVAVICFSFFLFCFGHPSSSLALFVRIVEISSNLALNLVCLMTVVESISKLSILLISIGLNI
mgnify:CR=1 FL=1